MQTSENRQPYRFAWHIGRLDDPQTTSLRFVPPLISREELRNAAIFYACTLLLSLLASLWLTLTLLLLPFAVLFYAALLQHLRFKDVVNKKFAVPLLPLSHLVESVLISKGLPYERTVSQREVCYALPEGLEVHLYPCREYIDPKNNSLRWMVAPDGKITDCAIRPATEELLPLIESLTLKLDEAVTSAVREEVENGAHG